MLQRAFDERRILITSDRDFGEKVYRERDAKHGVIYLRLADERSAVKMAVLERLLRRYAAQLPDRFVVVTETRVRFAGTVLP